MWKETFRECWIKIVGSSFRRSLSSVKKHSTYSLELNPILTSRIEWHIYILEKRVFFAPYATETTRLSSVDLLELPYKITFSIQRTFI